MPYSLLPSRALLALSGEECESFLQGIVSNDVAKLEQVMYAALLSPQGKFLHDFFLYRRGNLILLDVDASRAGDLKQRLTMYKLRSKVTITPLPAEGVAAVWGEPSSDVGYADPRLPQLGWRLAGDADALRRQCADKGWKEESPEAYDRMRLALGVPDGARDMIIDRSFLLEFGFEDLHGVDFNKGCYVGQEVTARSKHRAQLHKFLYQVKAEGGLPPAGTKITADGKEVGELRSHAGNIGLAILRTADVAAAAKAGDALQAGSVTIRSASIPAWVSAPPTAAA